jgi:hypothetical protein
VSVDLVTLTEYLTDEADDDFESSDLSEGRPPLLLLVTLDENESREPVTSDHTRRHPARMSPLRAQ